MRLHIVSYKILASFVGVDLCKNFCNNKSPHHLGSELFTEVFLFCLLRTYIVKTDKKSFQNLSAYVQISKFINKSMRLKRIS